MMKRVLGACALLCCLLFADPSLGQNASQWDHWRHSQSEYMKYLAGLPRVNLEFNPYNSSSRLARIYHQLVEYTGKEFAVFPAQTNRMGVSHNGGVIQIDISKLSEPMEILAFWLAHEWAHQDLGHQTNVYRPTPNQDWRYRVLPSAKEDDADRWAGRFLRWAGYDIGIVVSHLSGLPDSPYNHSYSTSWERASNLESAYSHGGPNDPVLCQFCQGTGGEMQQIYCQYCNGSGGVACEGCGGYGWYWQFGVQYQCGGCGGRGAVVCFQCSGAGQVVVPVQCTVCGGSGQSGW